MAELESPSPLADGAADIAQAPSLCTQCGLCCQGVLHARAVLEEDEVEPARAIGLPVRQAPDRDVFALPCPKLSGTACTIFGRRPRVCSRYRCQVLIDFEDHGLPYDKALNLVRQAQSYLADLDCLLPEGMTLREAQAVAGSFGSQDCKPETARPSPEVQLRSTVLQLFLDKHFRKPKEGKVLIMHAIENEDLTKR